MPDLNRATATLQQITSLIGWIVMISSALAFQHSASHHSQDSYSRQTIDARWLAVSPTQFLKIPQVLSLITLLASLNGGGDIGPSNPSPADDAMRGKEEGKEERVEDVGKTATR